MNELDTFENSEHLYYELTEEELDQASGGLSFNFTKIQYTPIQQSGE